MFLSLGCIKSDSRFHGRHLASPALAVNPSGPSFLSQLTERTGSPLECHFCSSECLPRSAASWDGRRRMWHCLVWGRCPIRWTLTWGQERDAWQPNSTLCTTSHRSIPEQHKTPNRRASSVYRGVLKGVLLLEDLKSSEADLLRILGVVLAELFLPVPTGVLWPLDKDAKKFRSGPLFFDFLWQVWHVDIWQETREWRLTKYII